MHCWYLVCPDDVERHTAWDIAHATSTNLIDWDLHGVVIERGSADAWDSDCVATGSVVKHKGSYVMACRLGCGTYAMVAPRAMGPYSFEQKEPILASGHPDQIYAGQVVHLDETAYLIGTVWQEHEPDYISDRVAIHRSGSRLIPTD